MRKTADSILKTSTHRSMANPPTKPYWSQRQVTTGTIPKKQLTQLARPAITGPFVNPTSVDNLGGMAVGPGEPPDAWQDHGNWITYQGGVVTGNATGSNMGPGTINATGFYVNGVSIGGPDTGDVTEAPQDGQLYARQNAGWSSFVTGISDAPSDGNLYCRYDNSWSPFVTITEAPSNGNLYARQNASWSSFSPGISDAPNNGSLYARQNANWTIFSPGIADAPSNGSLYARQNASWNSFSPGISDAPSDGNLYCRDNNNWTSSGNFSGQITIGGMLTIPRAQFTSNSVTASGSFALDRSLGEIQVITVNGNSTLTGITNWNTSGHFAKIVLDISNSGTYTLTWIAAPNLIWSGGTIPTLTPNGRDIFILFSYDGTHFFGNIVGQNYH